MIHLDTNGVIALLTGRVPKVLEQFEQAKTRSDDMAISCLVFHELRYGSANSARPHQNNARLDVLLLQGIAIIPFDADDAKEAADIRAHLKRLGTPIGPYDILIAAQARRRGATLVTANTQEFQRVPGLQVVDWAV